MDSSCLPVTGFGPFSAEKRNRLLQCVELSSCAIFLALWESPVLSLSVLVASARPSVSSAPVRGSALIGLVLAKGPIQAHTHPTRVTLCTTALSGATATKQACSWSCRLAGGAPGWPWPAGAGRRRAGRGAQPALLLSETRATFPSKQQPPVPSGASFSSFAEAWTKAPPRAQLQPRAARPSAAAASGPQATALTLTTCSS